MWVVEPDHGEDGAHFAAVIHLDTSSVQHTLYLCMEMSLCPTHLSFTQTLDGGRFPRFLRQQIH